MKLYLELKTKSLLHKDQKTKENMQEEINARESLIQEIIATAINIDAAQDGVKDEIVK